MKNTRSTLQDLIAKLKKADGGHAWHYLEVKQMADILKRHRDKAKAALREYRALKIALDAEEDDLEKLYLGYEGMFLRDHLRDALRLYLMVNHDYHDAFRAFMDSSMVAPVPAELLQQPKKQNSGRGRAA